MGLENSFFISSYQNNSDSTKTAFSLLRGTPLEPLLGNFKNDGSSNPERPFLQIETVHEGLKSFVSGFQLLFVKSCNSLSSFLV